MVSGEFSLLYGLQGGQKSLLRNHPNTPVNIVLLSPEKELAAAGQDVVRLFYRNSRIFFQPVDGYDIVLTVSASREGRFLTGKARLKTRTTSLEEEVPVEKTVFTEDTGNEKKRLIRLALYRLLINFTETPPRPWGILTGIRPTKIVHRLLDLAWGKPEIIDYLTANYALAADKADLLTGIAAEQRPFLLNKEQAENTISVYIGIPFCPTRCAYCSFPSYPVDRAGRFLEPFLEALKLEIKGLGQAVESLGRKARTIYIGGGTPTVLNSGQLSSVLESVRTNLFSDETVEITLEAGRPDTVTAEKLSAALEYGVTRLSINPQSMNTHTLSLIGRCHTPEDIFRSMEKARQTGFKNINMDMIIGLPGEGCRDIKHTLQEIGKMRPENLTVHTLAVKRASRIKEAKEYFNLPPREEVEKMLEITAAAALKMGMKPYYLYRQKNMVGPLENIGYAQPGTECIYNIQIIEERQTIVGLGGGAGSKFVEPGTWYLTSRYNPKDPETYIRKVDELVRQKVDMLTKGYTEKRGK